MQKHTMLTKAFISTLVGNTSNQRLRDIVGEIRARTPIELSTRGMSYLEIFGKIQEQGTLSFKFNGEESPDSDNELNGVSFRYEHKASGELSTFRMPYMSAIIATLPEYATKPETQTVTNKAGKAMKNVKDKAVVLGGGMVSGNKEALGLAVTLQAGRANNKVIKEAVRPLVKLMCKPSFMQRLLAKIFKVENPVDKFLDSPYGGLFAAQVAQAVVAAKGVENEKVKAVVVGGMAYSYNELGDELIPIDKAIDSVVETLTTTADKLIK